MDVWLVIRANKVNDYWPQPPPLQTETNHHFNVLATCASADTSHGETLTLMIVETKPDASQVIRSFLDNPQATGLGMSALPFNILLTQVTVIRS